MFSPSLRIAVKLPPQRERDRAGLPSPMVWPSIDTTVITTWVAEVSKASRVSLLRPTKQRLASPLLIHYIATHIGTTTSIAP
jgi:hypothetical protein